DEAQKSPQPSENQAEVVANCAQNRVGRIAFAALEIAAAEVAVGFHMSDDCFDRGATSQLALDHTEDTAALARDKNAAWIGYMVAAIALIDVGPLDGITGEAFGGLDRLGEGMAVVGITR